MISTVLADTGPLYAALDPDDRYHRRAQHELEVLQTGGVRILIAFTTQFECYSLVLRRLGVLIAHRWLNEILGGASLVTPHTDDFRSGARIALAFRDQPLTLFDSIVTALSSRLDIPVWAYDHHFDLMRVPVWRLAG